MNRILWAVQGLLAGLFLFAGGSKLMLPTEAMTAQMNLPGFFLRFIGVAEILGAIGLILPGRVNILPLLTPIAAVGLTIIMVGAAVVSAMSGPVVMALIPVVTGLLAMFVAWGRWRMWRDRDVVTGVRLPRPLRP